MQISECGIKLIKAWEGLLDGDPSTVELEPYLDAAGFLTIGWGHLVKEDEDFSDGITYYQADALLREDIIVAEKAVNKHVTRKLTQAQFDALVSFVFNVGETAFRKSTLLQWINANDRDLRVPQQFMRWVHSRGKPFRGLARRRVAESEMWLDGC